jgi:hypothetical protein
LAAGYAESRGVLQGWPPPFHSLKHPWLGYYSAWGVSRLRRNRIGAAVGVGVGADFVAESGQDIVNSHDHYPLHWLDSHNSEAGGDNVGNLIDFAACMGGTALFLAQNKGLGAWARQNVSQLRSKSSSRPVTPALNPVE